jgi:hypothetical protein
MSKHHHHHKEKKVELDTPVQNEAIELEATTEVLEKKVPSGYVAVVSYHQEPGSVEEGLGVMVPPEFIYASSKSELSKALSEPGISDVWAIFRGKKVEFTRQSVIKF